MKIVPEEPGGAKNVRSGTCVYSDGHDAGCFTSLVSGLSKSTSSADNEPGRASHVYESENDQDFSFLLTAQGGLKGTSKPVFYRVIWNENFLFPVQNGTSLTKDLLTKLTYCMSFQYGTATKSPRLVPVLKYGARLANTVLGYIDYLSARQAPIRLDLEDHEEPTMFEANGDPSILPRFSKMSFRPHLSA